MTRKAFLKQYGMRFADYEVKFKVKGGTLTVTDIALIISKKQ